MYDFIVVGAGVMGSSAAYTLAKQGKKTLLIEQFPIPHTRGSSHGGSRITRLAYLQSFQADIMTVANPMWKALAKEAETELLKSTGMLCVTLNEHEELSSYHRTIQKHTKQHVPLLDSADLSIRYPLMTYPKGETACYDAAAGILYASKCVQAFQKLFVRRGGVILDNCKVCSITPAGDTVTVHTANGDYQSKGVVLTCGPWANQLLGDLGVVLPLEVQSIKLGYFKTKNDIDHRKLPVFISFHEDGSFYGFPADEYDNMIKICLHYGYTVPCDPDARDKYDPERQARDMALLKDYVTEHFPGLIPEIAIQEMCMYTCTPDMNCIIDHHPVHKNIVYGAGFSGHGFKLSPMIGEMLAAIVQKKTHTFLSTSELRLERFTKTSKL